MKEVSLGQKFHRLPFLAKLLLALCPVLLQLGLALSYFGHFEKPEEPAGYLYIGDEKYPF